MANIGAFKKSGNEFQGEIVTLSVQTKGVRIVPETNRANDSAPSHRVYVGRAEIGAAWSKRSTEGHDIWMEITRLAIGDRKIAGHVCGDSGGKHDGVRVTRDAPRFDQIIDPGISEKRMDGKLLDREVIPFEIIHHIIN